MELPPDIQALIVIEVRGSIAPRVCEINRRVNQSVTWDETYQSRDSPDSREPTPDTTVEESVASFQIDFADHSTNGCSFGRSKSCEFRLPSPLAGRSSISSHHFRIYVSEYGTWMIRNESGNGTEVDGTYIKGSMALHPRMINRVRVQDITLSIHFPHGWLTPFRGGAPPFSTSARSSSTAFEPEPVPKYEIGSNSSYHILHQQRINFDGTQYEAIHIPTGRPVIAIRCGAGARSMPSQRRYDIISKLSSQTDSIVPYLDIVSYGDGDIIITEYVVGDTLEKYCMDRTLTDSELLGLFRQMVDLLCLFQQEGIEHGDIRQGTIIVTRRPFKVRLAGFSQCTEVDASLGLDVTNLCRTYQLVAVNASDHFGSEDAEEELMRGDPEIATLVHRVLSRESGKRMSALDVNGHIHSLVGDALGEPFAMATVTRSWHLRMRRKGKILFVEVAALLDRLLAQRRHPDPIRIRPRAESYANNFLCERQIYDGEQFCTSKQALRFCSEFNLQEFHRIIQIEVFKKRVLRISDGELITCEGKPERFQVGYHVSTMMFNLSHIAEVLGWRPDFREDFVEPKTFQEVHDEQWGGTYVNQNFCSTFLQGRHDGIRRSIGDLKAISNPVLSAQFTGNSPDHILLFTRRLKPSIVVVRRTDCFSNWTSYIENGSNFLSPEESYSKCDAERLPLIKKSIRTLENKLRTLNWSSWGPCLDTMEKYGSDTPVNTDESDDDGFKFTK